MSRPRTRRLDHKTGLSSHSTRSPQQDQLETACKPLKQQTPPLLRPHPTAQIQLPRLHEVLDLYTNWPTRASLALELPKLKCVPHLEADKSDMLVPQEPIRLVVHVPDKVSPANCPAEEPVSLVEPPKKPAWCNMFDKRFTTKSRLRVHSMPHSCKKPFRCELCNEQFAQRCGLTYHTRRVHTGERPYACSSCSRTFIQKTDLNKHRRIHERYERTTECTICHNMVPESALVRHASTHKPTG